MLDPRDRTLLLEALRPPEGYELSDAIGTTYSLDLTALLTAPLAFTIFDWEDSDGKPTADPLVLLEALRGYADRISIFCQAGGIKVPAQNQPLLGYLEESIIEVVPPNRDGVFHPKVWALRFIADDQPIRYRVLCLSRNLTFDFSWDTALVLDGELQNRANAYSVNHPLGDFIAALPAMALRAVTPKAVDRVRLIADEIRKVEFEMPPGIESVRFHPLGLNNRKSWPFPGNQRRLLVVSPFLSATTLKRLSKGREGCVLVSRKQALDETPPKVVAAFEEAFTLADEAQPEEEIEEQGTVPNGTTADSPYDEDSLSGLHAKLFVIDDGWKARVWTGSANATEAAFSRNVEMLIELNGWKRDHGIDTLMGRGNSGEPKAATTAFGDLLFPYRSPDEPRIIDATLEKAIRKARLVLATSGLLLIAIETANKNEWKLQLRRSLTSELSLPAHCTVVCRPITQQSDMIAVIDPGSDPLADFKTVSTAALTTFVAFTITASSDKNEARTHFVLNLPLEGGPTDRRDRILEHVLQDKRSVLRFILLLLADDHREIADLQSAFGQIATSPSGEPGPAAFLDIPLFETLMQALHRDKSKLVRLSRMVDDLSATENGRRLLPEGFQELWAPFREAIDG